MSINSKPSSDLVQNWEVDVHKNYYMGMISGLKLLQASNLIWTLSDNSCKIK